MITNKRIQELWNRYKPVDHKPCVLNKSKTAAEIYIYDEIMPEGFGGISALAVVQALQEANGLPLNIRINSPGGSVYEAKAIYNSLRNYKGTKTVIVDGLCASAATYIAMAGDTVETAPEATWMIHNAIGLAVGFATDMRKEADLLDMETGSIANLYARETDNTVEQCLAWMTNETFFLGPKAVEMGFADSVICAQVDHTATVETNWHDQMVARIHRGR